MLIKYFITFETKISNTMQIITSQMRENAENFVIRWRGTERERAESQTFINEFFEIFSLYRKDYAQFEKPIRKKNEHGTGFADLFWSGKLIIEAKSASVDSDKQWENTLNQAKEYIENLLQFQKPQYILLMNFKRFRLHKVEQLWASKKIKIHNFLIFIQTIKIKLFIFANNNTYRNQW